MTDREQGPAIDPEQARQWAALVVNPDACVPETANLARWALARDAEATRLEQAITAALDEHEATRVLKRRIEELNDNVERLEQENARLREALRFPRNTVLCDEAKLAGEWVAVPREDFDAARAELKDGQ